MSESELARVATAIVRDYGPGILGYLGALLGDPTAARDAFSEFSEELWKSLPKFQGESSAKTWAYAIAYRCALRSRRRRARSRTRPLRDSEYSQVVASVRSSTAAFARTGARTKLEELRATMTPEEQTLLVLRLDRGMSWDDIAMVMAKPAATLRKRFERLKARLRTAARDAGLVTR